MCVGVGGGGGGGGRGYTWYIFLFVQGRQLVRVPVCFLAHQDSSEKASILRK